MLDILKDAFKTAFNKPLTYAALIAIPLIVACFALLYFATFMDPYERMRELPIAVINQDAGATLNEEERNLGDELVESITNNDDAKWTIEDESLLDRGLENTDYYLAIVIPEDFSEHVAAGETKEPEQANVVFFKNARKNYMLTSLSSRIESALKEKVNQSITEQYLKAYLGGLVNAKDGLADAADGSQQLGNGIDSAVEGSSAITNNLETLKSGSETLEDGLGQLNSGLSQMEDSGDKLVSGSASIASGIETLAQGSSTYRNGIEDKVNSISSAYGGDPANAIPQLKQNYALALQEYTTQVIAATKQGQDPSQINTAQVSAAAEKLAAASSQAGAYQALASAVSGYKQIDSGIGSLSSQYQTLDTGINQYARAISQLSVGAQNAQNGAASLTNGTGKLQDGSQKLTSGLLSASDGAGELTSSLRDGSQTIDNSLTDSTDNLASYTANPAIVEDDVYGNLDKFGYGFAPLFLVMGLWLGSLMIFFVFSAFPSKKELAERRFAAVVGRWPLYLLLSVLEVAIVFFGAQALGLPTTDMGMMALSLLIISVSFMLIMQFFNLFDIVGKAFSILLVAVQLVFCSGTMPAQLGSNVAVAAGPFLPFYYAIDGLREVMSGGNVNVLATDMVMLLLFASGAVVLSLLLYPIALKIKTRKDSAALSEYLKEAAYAAKAMD